jgi:hypothetical protein
VPSRAELVRDAAKHAPALKNRLALAGAKDLAPFESESGFSNWKFRVNNWLREIVMDDESASAQMIQPGTPQAAIEGGFAFQIPSLELSA